MKLYEIQREIEEIYYDIEKLEGEIAPELEARLDALGVEKGAKVEAILAIIQGETECQEMYKREQARLKKLKKRSENTVERLRRYLLAFTGPEYKQSTKLGKFSWKKTIKTELDEDVEPVEQYRNYQTTWTPDKATAKKDWLESECKIKIDGFNFIENFTPQLR